MPFFHAHVRYEGELHGWERAGRALVDITQDNALLDAQRDILAAEFPRRKFETELQITVGGLRAAKGTYYQGPRRATGVAQLSALQAAHKLGLVAGTHLITKVFDRDDHSRDEGTHVSTDAHFSGVHRQAATSFISVHTHGAFGERHLAALVATAWQTFIRIVEVAPIVHAYGGWDDRTDDWLRPEPGEPPVAAFMVVFPHVIERLGGVRTAVGALGAFDARPVHGDPSQGVAMQLARRPDDITDDRLAELRAVLRD